MCVGSCQLELGRSPRAQLVLLQLVHASEAACEAARVMPGGLPVRPQPTISHA